ncbi:MAG: division/cell wall cluster transcriptional repressor MraZ [Candidatus Harrisonbacteria bacterium]|nr:division/cell wall cluster transcriptional repressor MraZ [Candidatus Harrisonbacteria bacterium]
MFIGEYKHAVDEKGRVAVPAKFRTSLNKAAVITRGLDRCLFVFTASEWKELAEKIKALPMTQANARSFSRLMFSGAVDVDIDSQGRILIPDYLREYAGISKKAVVAGVYSRIEIWDEEAWDSYKTQTEGEADEIAERLNDLGI